MVKERKLNVFDFVGLAIYSMIGALIGAKGLFILVSWKQIVALKLSFIEILRGGFVFYGGLIGGAIGFFLYAKQFKITIKEYIAIFTTVIPLGHAFGRVGCFFAGCCYGIAYDGFAHIVYKESADIATPLGVGLFPVQLLEAILLLALFVFLWLARRKNSLVIYGIGYALIRIGTEFLRGDVERGVFLGFSTSQWISIGIVLVIGITYIWKKIKTRA